MNIKSHYAMKIIPSFPLTLKGGKMGITLVLMINTMKLNKKDAEKYTESTQVDLQRVI